MWYTIPAVATYPTDNPTNSIDHLGVLPKLSSALTELDTSLHFVAESRPNCPIMLIAVNVTGATG